jgi:methylase of polypeptide subunit release factors
MSDDEGCTIQFDDLHIDYAAGLLTPRPWTVAQSRWAHERSGDLPSGPVLELCCGAGHIGLAAAVRCDRPLVQVDIDPLACIFAKRNAERAAPTHEVTVLCGSIEWAAELGEHPIVLADPPYLERRELDRYPDDPVLAVDGGDDGMELLRSCLRTLPKVMHRMGIAIVQVRGARQARALEQELRRGGHPLSVEALRTFGPDRALVMLRRRHLSLTRS